VEDAQNVLPSTRGRQKVSKALQEAPSRNTCLILMAAHESESAGILPCPERAAVSRVSGSRRQPAAGLGPKKERL